MPSLFGLLGKKSNPYLNAHHPGHNALPQSTSKASPEPRYSRTLLEEAREVAGRHPITGRRLHGSTSNQSSSGNSTSPAALKQVEEEQRTAFQSRAVQSKQTTGQRYELSVQEMVKKRDEESRARAARGGLEYYAPERRLEEFYVGGVRD